MTFAPLIPTSSRPSAASLTLGMAALCAALLVLPTRAGGAPPCAAPPPVVDSVCQRSLREKNAELQTLLTKFTELHPDVRALRRAIAQLGECELNPAPPVTTTGEECEPADPGHAHGRSAGAPATIPRKAGEPAATITINLARTRQSLDGFGATHYLDVLARNRMTDSQWRRTITGLVTEIGVTTGVAPPPVEYATPKPLVPGSRFSRPIDFTSVETLFKLYDRFTPGGIGDIYPTANINTIWHHRWLTELKSRDYPRYLEDVAGKAVETVAEWVAKTGREPEFLQLWNEPLSGNGELVGGNVRDLIESIKATGRRLRAAGYARVRLVVPNEETVQRTLEDMRAIAQDREALSFIGAIGYHAYPYASDYSYIPRLLRIRAQGGLPDAAIQERLELRGLSKRLGIPVWMTEVSNGYTPAGPRGDRESYVPIDWLIGRAIHIHDEFRYAGASAYYGMLAVWTDVADRDHFAPFGGSENLLAGEDNLILVDTASDQVVISATGRAIGHYGRWLRRGALYVEAESSSPLILVSPFVDRDRLVAVLVNTASTKSRVTIKLEGSKFSGVLTGEQSRAAAQWQPLPPVEAIDSTFTIEVPEWSVTTVAVPVRGR